MGKAQKKKAIRHRHNPIRVPDSHLGPGLAAADTTAASAKRDAVLPIMQKVRLHAAIGMLTFTNLCRYPTRVVYSPKLDA